MTDAPRRTIVILGATSAIARGVAEEFARRGDELLLAGRDTGELAALADDLAVRFGGRARGMAFDAVALETHAGFVESCREASGGSLAGVVLCFGYLGDQAAAQRDLSEARRIFDTNLLGAVSILSLFANHFEERREGFLCAVSSVAGERGRQSNYFYGAAKAGLNVFLQGLRNRLASSGVRVITIKPGFVDTRMTYGRKGMLFVASPRSVARHIVAAIVHGKDQAYVPALWRPVMLMIRLIPERIFKRMRL